MMASKVVTLLLCFGFCAAAPANQKIVGGVETTIDDVPYQLELQVTNYINEWIFYCGAVVIGETDVLTSAVCVYEDGAEKLRILSGSTNRENGTVHTVEVVTIHPDFHFIDYVIPVNDIAYLKVTPAFNLNSTSTKAIKLTEKEPVAGDVALASGWGNTAYLDEEQPIAVRKVEVPIVSREYCESLYGEYFDDSMICAGLEEGGKDTCFWDDGGPLVVNGTLAGITQIGPACGQRESFSTYTNINEFKSWINEQVAANK